MDDAARRRIANYVHDIMMEQTGISIKEDYPIIYNVIIDEDYAIALKNGLDVLLGEINNKIPSVKDVSNVKKNNRYLQC